MNCNEAISVDESHKRNVKWKKSDTEECLLGDSVYMEVQNK